MNRKNPLLLSLLFRCAIQLFLLVVNVASFSATPTPRQFIELTNPLKEDPRFGVQGDRLPASFVLTWPTWVLDTTTRTTTTQSNSNNNSVHFKWERIPDSGGFVVPTSLDELWQPQDLKLPQCQLAVGLHVRHGMIRHILPAVDLSFAVPAAAATAAPSTNHSGRSRLLHHRNRGLRSVPRAYRWMDFGAAVAGGLDVASTSLQFRRRTTSRISQDDNDDNNNIENDDDPYYGDEWETVTELGSIKKTVNRAIEALAEDPPEALGVGSCIVHVLLDQDAIREDITGETVIDCPRPGSEMRVLLEEDGVTVGTLQVCVEKTAPGSESEYLPVVYKPLYNDESLRRPAFVEARERLLELQAKQEEEDTANF